MALGGRRRGRDGSPAANSTNERPAQRPRRFCPADVVEMAKAVAEAFGPGGNEELAVIRKAVEDKASDVVKTAAATEMATAIVAIGPMVTQAVKEQVAAERLSHPASAIAKTTADLVISGVKTRMDADGAYPTAGVPFEQRSLDEIRVAVGRAISMPMIRRAHALAVSVRVLSLANDAEANGDCATPFCPTASKSAGTSSFAVKNYNRVIMAVYNKLLVDMAASGNQPAVFKGKSRVTPTRLDRIDLVALSIIRTAFNDGRSVARELMYSMLGYANMQLNPAVSLRLAYPDETVAPKAADAVGSKYYRATTTLVASVSGILGGLAVAGLPLAEGEDLAGQDEIVPQATPGQRTVVRHFCLFRLANDVLVALVRHAHDFEADVIMCLAECFRARVVAGRDAWREAVDISSLSDAAKGPCCWGLLLPRLSKRAQLDTTIQQLKGSELAAPAGAAAAAAEAPVDAMVEDDGADMVDELGA